jgi:hypothetical protein
MVAEDCTFYSKMNTEKTAEKGKKWQILPFDYSLRVKNCISCFVLYTLWEVYISLVLLNFVFLLMWKSRNNMSKKSFFLDAYKTENSHAFSRVFPCISCFPEWRRDAAGIRNKNKSLYARWFSRAARCVPACLVQTHCFTQWRIRTYTTNISREIRAWRERFNNHDNRPGNRPHCTQDL